MSKNELYDKATYFFRLMAEGKSREEIIKLMKTDNSNIIEEPILDKPITKKTKKKSK